MPRFQTDCRIAVGRGLEMFDVPCRHIVFSLEVAQAAVRFPHHIEHLVEIRPGMFQRSVNYLRLAKPLVGACKLQCDLIFGWTFVLYDLLSIWTDEPHIDERCYPCLDMDRRIEKGAQRVILHFLGDAAYSWWVKVWSVFEHSSDHLGQHIFPRPKEQPHPHVALHSPG